jgi:hypothetical protein
MGHVISEVEIWLTGPFSYVGRAITPSSAPSSTIVPREVDKAEKPVDMPHDPRIA